MGYPIPGPGLDGGTPPSEHGPGQGTSPVWIQLGYPPSGPGRGTPRDMDLAGVPPPPRCGLTHKLKILPSLILWMQSVRRKYSFVNTRGILTTAYQVLHMLSCPGGGGGGGRGRYLGLWGLVPWGIPPIRPGMGGRYLGVPHIGPGWGAGTLAKGIGTLGYPPPIKPGWGEVPWGGVGALGCPPVGPS